MENDPKDRLIVEEISIRANNEEINGPDRYFLKEREFCSTAINLISAEEST